MKSLVALHGTLAASPRQGRASGEVSVVLRVVVTGPQGDEIKVPVQVIGERARHIMSMQLHAGAHVVVHGELAQQGTTSTYMVKADLVAVDEFPTWSADD